MPTDEEARVLAEMQAAFRARIPSGSAIARRAVARAIQGHEADAAWIKQNFSELVEQVQVQAYQEYLEAEKAVGRDVIKEVFLPKVKQNGTPSDTLDVLGANFYALDRFFLGLTQGRRPRAGGAFEYLIRELFTRLGYPFTAQAIINGQPDFILPSEAHFRRNPMDAIIFTVKRTLRERWRQIVTEGTRGLGFFLATIDEDIAQRDLQDMLNTRIHLVVPGRVKNLRADYQAAANVITFETFFQYHLDPGMQRWRAAGVIR